MPEWAELEWAELLNPSQLRSPKPDINVDFRVIVPAQVGSGGVISLRWLFNSSTP